MKVKVEINIFKTNLGKSSFIILLVVSF